MCLLDVGSLDVFYVRQRGNFCYPGLVRKCIVIVRSRGNNPAWSGNGGHARQTNMMADISREKRNQDSKTKGRNDYVEMNTSTFGDVSVANGGGRGGRYFSELAQADGFGRHTRDS